MNDHPRKLDPRPGDPFFEVINDGEWNATIGQQGHVENYLDGYIEGAIELADLLFEKELCGKRDTLVLPILYNARHALELNLKFAADKLGAAGILKGEDKKTDHDIARYWQRLHDANIADLELNGTVECLKPYVDSLTQIDRDGQELRYHRNRDDELSLAQFALVNLRLVRESLHELKNLLEAVKYGTIDLVDERRTGTFTPSCSRKDLYAIAKALPRRSQWGEPEFDERKARIRAIYNLSSKGFQKAIGVIESTRELRGIIGLESDLLHLTDEDILWVTQQWRRLHPKREHKEEEPRIHAVNAADLYGELMKDRTTEQKVYRAIAERLDAKKLAELETLFYLGRERHHSEYYEEMVEDTIRDHAAAKDKAEEIRHLMSKMNFLMCLSAAASKVGRLSLSVSLKDM